MKDFMIRLFLLFLFFPAWVFLTNEWMTLAHMWFCLQRLVHLQKGPCESKPHQTKEISTLYSVRTKAGELEDFPGVNTPLNYCHIHSHSCSFKPFFCGTNLCENKIFLKNDGNKAVLFTLYENKYWAVSQIIFFYVHSLCCSRNVYK